MWGNTPLHWGSRNGYEMVVRELLAAKADTLIENHKKNSPIDDARSNNNVACLSILQLASLRESKWTLVRRYVHLAFQQDHDTVSSRESRNTETAAGIVRILSSKALDKPKSLGAEASESEARPRGHSV